MLLSTTNCLLLLYTLTLAGFEGRSVDVVAAARAHTDPAHFNAVAKSLATLDGLELDPVVAARELAARTDAPAVEAVATAAFNAYVGPAKTGSRA